MVVAYLSANLERPEGGEQDKDIVSDVAAAGLECMLANYLPHWCPWWRGGRTWSMVCMGRKVQSRTDYILGMDLRLFRNVSVWNPRRNHIIKWSSGDSASPPWGNTQSTSGGACGFPDGTQPPWQDRMGCLRTFDGISQRPRWGRQGRTHISWWTLGGSSTQESLHT